ncbi:metalloregulator ArsR/SmtB family transcription factor [Synechococcus sp. RedBA-s]|uniref:ArsR/SmtB family transcription factor n=1 Tax=Synechococcus sp. RedBA-s TaxID=2823741 RepID=UPI0028F447B1|nr:metalloregulator ArsR/SmtB family transcription factor [Synechococcus sp. RedBA-s]MCP9800474.1 helix-turn-helix transcriptional regulator [Synechococcus sp. RedBA-s]
MRLQVIHSPWPAVSAGVCDLVTDLSLAQSKLLFHLKVLKQAGLLADRKEGRWVYYRLRPEILKALQAWLADLVANWGTLAKPCP